MSRAALLVEELTRLAAQIRAGEMLDYSERVKELMTRSRLVAKGNPGDIQRIAAALESLDKAVRARMEDIESSLREVGTRRTALSAYGAIRGHHTAQNLRTRV